MCFIWNSFQSAASYNYSRNEKERIVSKYKIVFISMEIPEHHRERVKANLSIIFKAPVRNLAPLFTDKPVTIKKDLDLVEANRYRDTIEREGGICRVEPMSDGTSSMSMQIEVVAKRDVITCPRCATRQEKTPICSGCGVILQSFDNEIREHKTQQAWVKGVNRDRRVSNDRRLIDDRRVDLRFQDDRRTGSERRASISGWHRNKDAARG